MNFKIREKIVMFKYMLIFSGHSFPKSKKGVWHVGCCAEP
jgi:hypothetical protein